MRTAESAEPIGLRERWTGMWHGLLFVALVASACGTAATRTPAASATASPAQPPSPSASPSSAVGSLRARVAELAGSLAFRVYAPDDLPANMVPTVALTGAGTAGTLGEPLLAITFTRPAGGKPLLSVVQGPGGCCLAASRAGAVLDTVIRTRAPRFAGDPHTEVRGELIRPGAGSSPIEGPTLWWHEDELGRTYVALTATTFAPELDAEALRRVAASMRLVDPAPVAGSVLLYWTTHESHSPNGHRLSLGVRSGAVPDEARLLDPSGQLVASAAFGPPRPSEGCLGAAASVAALAVPREVVRAFRPDIAAGYRVEARVGGTWRPGRLVSIGCVSME